MAFGVGSLVAAARADVPPPPPGERRHVRYGVRIASTERPPFTRRLVLYPVGSSDGAPQPEYRVVGEGDEVELARGAGPVGSYAVPSDEVGGATLRRLPRDAGDEVLAAYFGAARVAKAELEAGPVGTLDEATVVRVVTHGFSVASFGPDGLVMRHSETQCTYEDGERETVAPGSPASRSLNVWQSPLVWVALAVASNALFANFVLVFVRRSRDPFPPPS